VVVCVWVVFWGVVFVWGVGWGGVGFFVFGFGGFFLGVWCVFSFFAGVVFFVVGLGLGGWLGGFWVVVVLGWFFFFFGGVGDCRKKWQENRGLRRGRGVIHRGFLTNSGEREDLIEMGFQNSAWDKAIATMKSVQLLN